MLQNKLKVLYDVENQSLWLRDVTGVYDPNNENGYGSPNPPLSQVALISILQYINEGVITKPKLLSSSSIIHSQGLPDDDLVEFQYKYQRDGHYLAAILVLEVSPDGVSYLSGGSVASGDYFYNSTDGKIYLLIDGNPTEVTDIDSLIDNKNVIQAVCQRIITIKSDLTVADIYNKSRTERRQGNQEKYLTLLHRSSYLQANLNGIKSNFYAGMTKVAENDLNSLLEEFEIE